MIKIWNYISYLGLHGKGNTIEYRNVIIANRLNFVLLVIFLLLNIVTTIFRELNDMPQTMHTKRLVFLFVACLLNITLAYFSYTRLMRLLLIINTPFLLVFLPMITGFAQTTDYIYTPLIIIGITLIPQLVLTPSFKNPYYVVALFFFLIQIFFFKDLLDKLLTRNNLFEKTVVDFGFYYRVVIVATFMFIQAALYYLRNMNLNYEKELTESNKELNAAIEELKSLQNHLVQTEKMASLGTLTAGIAHEINNPLNYINGGLFLMNDLKDEIQNNISEPSKQQCDNAQKMLNDGLEKVTKIVGALMTFSYVGKPELVNSDLNKIIDNTLLFIKTKIPNDVQIIKDYNLEREVPIFADKIHQVVMSIVDNAVDAVSGNDSNNKEITISTYQEDQYAVMQFSNNGPQIPDKITSRIFDPFFTTKDPDKGTGLGLSICYSAIKEHNGTIEAVNLPDGVQFIIKLPM